MNFDLTEDEELLKALAERFVEDRYDIDRRRAYLAAETGFSCENWRLMGELGLLAAPLAQRHGGLGLNAASIAVVLEVLGRGLVVEPLTEAVLVAGRLFAATAPAALADAWLPGLLEGRRRIVLAHAEAASRGGFLHVTTHASGSSETVALSGNKPFVIAGFGADGFIVSARRSGAPDDPAGLGLYFVEAGAPGLAVAGWRLADGSVAAGLTLDAVPAAALCGGGDALSANETLAVLARSAESLGIMQRLFDDTLDYLRTRKQFGVALGTFQAIQHRMAHQYGVLEQSRALLNLAIVSEAAPEFAEAVQGLRAFVAPAGLELGHEMIQFHGGMGVTDELLIGHGHKRLLVLSRWPERPDAALDRFAGVI